MNPSPSPKNPLPTHQANRIRKAEEKAAAARLATFEASKRGVAPPSKALVIAKEGVSEGEEEVLETTKQVVGIPGFWLQAMRNNQVRRRRSCPPANAHPTRAPADASAAADVQTRTTMSSYPPSPFAAAHHPRKSLKSSLRTTRTRCGSSWTYAWSS